MDTLVEAWMASSATTLLVGMAVFTALVYLVARNDSLVFARGVLRVIASAISSPLLYFRASMRALATYGRRGEDSSDSDQFLLNRFMTILQAVIVVSTFAGVTVGLVTAWKKLIPPADIRASYRESKKALESANTELATVTAELQRLDTQWTSQQQDAIRTARQPEEQKEQAAAKAMKDAEETATQFGGAAAAVMADLKTQSDQIGQLDPGDDYALQRASNSFIRIVNGHWYSLADEDRTLANAWIEQWTARAAAQQALGRITADYVRAQVQPTFSDVSQRRESLQTDVAAKESTVKILGKESRLRFGAAGWTLLTTAVSCLLVIWIYGLVLEALWLAIRVAGDVKRIRLAVHPAADELSTLSPLPMSVTQLQPQPAAAGLAPRPTPAAT